jgi:regulator of replication initiation timing
MRRCPACEEWYGEADFEGEVCSFCRRMWRAAERAEVR